MWPFILFMFAFRHEKAFICNYKEHWFTVRKLGQQVRVLVCIKASISLSQCKMMFEFMDYFSLFV